MVELASSKHLFFLTLNGWFGSADHGNRRNNHKWKLPSSIQNWCFFGWSSCTSSDFTVSIPKIQSCLGDHIRGKLET